MAIASTEDGRIRAEYLITVGADALVTCADLALEAATDLLVVAAPGLGACEVDRMRGADLLVRCALDADAAHLARVPAGSVHAVVRRAGQADRTTAPQDMIAGRMHVVGVGW